MDLAGKHQLQGTPEQVWNALHDTALLARCVPGCKQIEWIGGDTLEAEIELSIGNTHRSYRGRVRIADADPHRSYRLLFGESGQANSVVAVIELEQAEDLTHLSYAVEAQLDGYLARVGTPIARAVAKRIAKRFFKQLNSALKTTAVS
ncbi:MAG TPA: carbon monoxide dehydrogenase subunit G [Gammaproteobacteria bacterium]|nr:carbon monoxide dehydrogenase subunit G [Gammaproteobacteria bacterium]